MHEGELEESGGKVSGRQIDEKVEQSLREALEGFADSYVIIGGAACSIVMKRDGYAFRATRDIDMVVRTEGHLRAFAERLWAYINAGRYRYGQRSRHTPNVYRFTDPEEDDYPAIIELFSCHPDFELKLDNSKTPIHIADDIESLSAIVLDDEYYALLQQGQIVSEGLSVLDESYIIPFKAKAWLDLNRRRSTGEHVDASDINKHKKDVFRLAQTLDESAMVHLTGAPHNDMAEFLDRMKDEDVPLKQIGIQLPKRYLIDLMRSVYDCAVSD